MQKKGIAYKYLIAAIVSFSVFGWGFFFTPLKHAQFKNNPVASALAAILLFSMMAGFIFLGAWLEERKDMKLKEKQRG